MNIATSYSIRGFRRRLLIFALCFGLVTIGCIYVNFNPIAFFTEFHYVKNLLGEMFMPDFKRTFSSPSISLSIAQTLSMAFLGTLFGCITALGLGFMAAGNIMPWKGI